MAAISDKQWTALKKLGLPLPDSARNNVECIYDRYIRREANDNERPKPAQDRKALQEIAATAYKLASLLESAAPAELRFTLPQYSFVEHLNRQLAYLSEQATRGQVLVERGRRGKNTTNLILFICEIDCLLEKHSCERVKRGDNAAYIIQYLKKLTGAGRGSIDEAIKTYLKHKQALCGEISLQPEE